MPSIVFTVLCLAFIIYTFSIYFDDAEKSSVATQHTKAGEGKLVWQKHNCQSCHQLYGLGGYLGPDLTNVSSKIANDIALEAIISSGNERMPSYHMDKTEMQALLAFLHAMDATGNADPRNFRKSINGMIYAK